MKTLSIMQPWAWLIAQGIKPVENRGWMSSYRGPLLIHASKTFDWQGLPAIADIDEAIYHRTLQHFGLDPARLPMKGTPPKGEFGGIVAKVNMTDCVRWHRSIWFFGPCGFCFKDAGGLPFHPCRGYQSFFNVDIAI